METSILIIIWLGLSFIGLRNSWYQIKYFDKIIHILAGIAVTSYLFLNGYSVKQIFIINIVLAVLFEFAQLYTRNIFNLKKIGFPDGYYDIGWHLTGTIGYLQYKGELW